MRGRDGESVTGEGEKKARQNDRNTGDADRQWRKREDDHAEDKNTDQRERVRWCF